MVLDEILDERVSSSRRSRVNFRRVKRKMSNYSNYNLRPRARQPTRRLEIDNHIEVIK